MAESKTTLLNVKITKTELATINAVAADQKMNRSRFVREAIYDRLHGHFSKQPTSAAIKKPEAKEPDKP